ncbi:MAG: hypothetical protein WA194_05090 [Patescibacteria group bacterium]
MRLSHNSRYESEDWKNTEAQEVSASTAITLPDVSLTDLRMSEITVSAISALSEYSPTKSETFVHTKYFSDWASRDSSW